MGFAVEGGGPTRRAIRRASEWWDVNRPAALGALEEELVKAIEQLSIHPYSGQAVARDDPSRRRLLLGKTGHWLFYRVLPRVRRVWIHKLGAPRKREP
jgi:hypothetical protein